MGGQVLWTSNQMHEAPHRLCAPALSPLALAVRFDTGQRGSSQYHAMRTTLVTISDPALWPGTMGIVLSCLIQQEDQQDSSFSRSHVIQAMLSYVTYGGQSPSIPAMVGKMPSSTPELCL